MVNPFRAVSQVRYDELLAQLQVVEQERDDAKREASSLRAELKREVENGERLTALAARAIKATEILEQTLIERQIGAKKDPSLVLVVNNLPEAPKARHGFTPLRKRRRAAAKRSEAEQLRRNALPKLTAELPAVPLTKQDREVMREAINQVTVQESA